MRRLSIGLLLSSTVLTVRPAVPLAAGPPSAPFRFLQPVIQFTDEEQRRLDEREVVLRILPASGHELAFLAAGSLEVGADALVASVRDMAGLKRSSYVPQIGRFSSAPRMEDVRELTLDPADL